ncbi:MAG: hypothetical protein FWG02_05355 [Holophagaceae bacterium]|nr:hypothetical protein [Holophagaceae bacterium]
MKKSVTAPYKGYTPTIEYSQEDGCFIGKVLGLNLHGISFEGQTEDEIRVDFENAIDFYLETTENPENQFDGFITLQITPEMHWELYGRAKRAGNDNLNAWLVKELKESVLHLP